MSNRIPLKAASSVAFDEFIAANLVTLVGYIKMHVNNVSDENGRVQDTLLAAIQAYADFNGDSSFELRLIDIAKLEIAHYYYHDNPASHAAIRRERLKGIAVLSSPYQNIFYKYAIAANTEMLTRYIALHISNQTDVDGRVQDTLLAALQSYSHFHGECSLKTWLISIAKRQIALYYRRVPNATDCLPYDDDIASTDAILEDECYRSARNQELLEGISAIPTQDQQLLHWHAVDGLNHAHIGKKLGISEAAVNTRISRLRAALRQKMKNK